MKPLLPRRPAPPPRLFRGFLVALLVEAGFVAALLALWIITPG